MAAFSTEIRSVGKSSLAHWACISQTDTLLNVMVHLGTFENHQIIHRGGCILLLQHLGRFIRQHVHWRNTGRNGNRALQNAGQPMALHEMQVHNPSKCVLYT